MTFALLLPGRTDGYRFYAASHADAQRVRSFFARRHGVVLALVAVQS